MPLRVDRVILAATLAGRGLRSLSDLEAADREAASLEAAETLMGGLRALACQYKEGGHNDAAEELAYVAIEVKKWKDTRNGNN